jgi:hypothetical protein
MCPWTADDYLRGRWSKISKHNDQVTTQRGLRSADLPPFAFMLSRSASANTSCTPLPVFAEHSMYLAPISCATSAPCSDVTGFWPCAPSRRRVLSSRRKSVLVATRMSGVPSQKWATSGYHLRHVLLIRANPDEYKAALSTHLILDVPKANGEVDGKHDENDVAFWIAQRPQTIVLLLPCCVPQRNLDDFALELSVCHVVLKYGGDVCLVRWPPPRR